MVDQTVITKRGTWRAMPTKSSGCGRARRETLGTELWGLSDVVPESQESAQWLSNCHWELQKCVLRVAVFLARETKLGPVVSACERPVSVKPSINIPWPPIRLS
jgi:hypothetical protein